MSALWEWMETLDFGLGHFSFTAPDSPSTGTDSSLNFPKLPAFVSALYFSAQPIHGLAH